MAVHAVRSLRYKMWSCCLLLACLSSSVRFVSCGSSTAASSSTTTTTLSPTTGTTTTAASTTSPTVPANTDLAYCTCNLRPNECDVNCCCDPDCSASDRLSFSSCYDQFTPPINTKACIQSSQVFVNNTPYTVQVTQSGLFCVYFDNYNSANYYNPPTLVTDDSTFSEYLDLYGSYSYSTDNNAQSSSIPQTNNTQYYVSGDPIIVVYNTNSAGNGTVGYLALPAASASSRNCLNTNPAAYLYSQDNVCTQPVTNLATECVGNPMLNAATYYQNFKVVTTPSIFYTANGTALPTVPLYDSDQLINITINGTLLQPQLNGNFCENAVEQVTYTIIYAGTDGIASVSVAFKYVELTASLLPFQQTFQAQFFQNGSSENVIAYSGNPGYLVSEPVRAGTYVSSSQPIQLGPVRTDWLTVVSSNANGLCSDNAQDRAPVRFGINMRSGCFISFSYNNMSSLCNQSQNYAVQALVGGDLSTIVSGNLRIAEFGNTPVNDVQNWVQASYTFIGPGTGCSLTSASTGLQTGQCNNIITGMNIQIIYANAGAINNPQPAIIGAQYQFYCQSVLNYQCVGEYCQPTAFNSTSQKFQVFSSVTFVDASNPPVGAYGQIPTVSSTLPADFFYPFT